MAVDEYIFTGLEEGALSLFQRVGYLCDRTEFSADGEFFFCQRVDELLVFRLGEETIPAWAIGLIAALGVCILVHLILLVGWILRRRQLAEIDERE